MLRMLPSFAGLPGNPDGANRFAGRAAAGTGDAGDRDRDLRARILERTDRHRADHGFADGAVLVYQRGVHAQHFGLGGVGVGDKAALEPVAGARHIGAAGGDQAAGAAFGSGQLPLVLQ